MEQGLRAREGRSKGAWLLALLVLAPLLPALLSPLFPGLALHGHDLEFTFGPKFEYAARHFPRLPLWHPEIYCGHPFAGNPQSMALYPPSWILHGLGWSLPLASWWTAAHVLLAAFTFRALARRLGAGDHGACLGGLAWALGGQGMGRLFAGHLSWSTALPWIPLLFLGVHGCATGRGRFAAVQSGLAAGLLAVCGAPQAAAMAGLGAGLCAGFLLLGESARHGPNVVPGRLGLLGLAALFALPLVLAQALPTQPLLEGLGEGGRIASANAGDGAMHPTFLATLLFPLHFGPVSRVGGFAWEQAGYVGIAGLLLALRALLLRRGRETLFPFGLVAVGVLGALGPGTVLFDLLQALPLFEIFRTPGRMMLLATLGLAWLASLGFPKQGERSTNSFRAQLATRLAAGALLATGGVLAVAPALAAGVTATHALLSRMFGLSVLAGAALLLGWPGAWSPGRARGLLVLHAVELVVLLGPLALFPPRHPPGDLDALEQGLQALPGAEERAFYRVDHPDLGALGLFGELNRRGIRSTRGYYDPGVESRYRRWLDALDQLRAAGLPVEHALDLMAVRYVFAKHPEGKSISILRLGEQAFLIERPPPPERFRWAREPLAVPDEEAWWRLLLDPQGTPPDPRTVVTLLAGSEPLAHKGPGGEGRIRLLGSGPDWIDLEVEADGPGYVVLSELLVPGWRATLDGKPVPLLRADLLFQAVAIQAPGCFTVSLRYGPPGAGWLLRGLVLLGLFGGLGLAYRHGSKSARPSSPATDIPACS